jgi:large subunit ribosomal protein L28
MSRVCDLSGKKTAFGQSRKHKRGSSGGGGHWRFKAQATKRTWRPNLRKLKVMIDGTPTTIKVSMKMYKKIRKESEAQ